MDGKRIVIDCSTGIETLIEPDVEFLAQRVKDAEESAARKIVDDAKIAYDKKITDEMRKLAEESLIEKGVIE